MIFVTVGTQLPFDRLVRAVDKWASKAAKFDVFAQTGESKYAPSTISSSNYLGVNEFDRKVGSAELLISHAGMGSIITAMEMSKPIVIMPREAKFGEHRNDHQLATVNKFRKLSNVFVAESEEHLAQAIDAALSANDITVASELTSRQALISSISSFIGSNEMPARLSA